MMNYVTQLKSIENFPARLSFVKTIDLEKVKHPMALIECFYDAKDQEDPLAAAQKVARAFKISHRPVLLDAQVSYESRKYQTIMDVFESKEGKDPAGHWLLRLYFTKAGFKNAKHYKDDMLNKMFTKAGYKHFRREEYELRSRD